MALHISSRTGTGCIVAALSEDLAGTQGHFKALTNASGNHSISGQVPYIPVFRNILSPHGYAQSLGSSIMRTPYKPGGNCGNSH